MHSLLLKGFVDDYMAHIKRRGDKYEKGFQKRQSDKVSKSAPHLNIKHDGLQNSAKKMKEEGLIRQN
jgi:hypothetical protein